MGQRKSIYKVVFWPLQQKIDLSKKRAFLSQMLYTQLQPAYKLNYKILTAYLEGGNGKLPFPSSAIGMACGGGGRAPGPGT